MSRINQGLNPTGSGNPVVVEPSPNTATVTRVGSSTTAVTLASANVLRRGFIIFNDSNSVLYVKFGPSASTTDFTTYLPSGTMFDITPNLAYVGEVSGIWTSVDGAAQVTEMF